MMTLVNIRERKSNISGGVQSVEASFKMCVEDLGSVYITQTRWGSSIRFDLHDANGNELVEYSGHDDERLRILEQLMQDANDLVKERIEVIRAGASAKGTVDWL